MNEQVYTNYRLQLPEQELLGTLVVRDGAIADIQPGIQPSGQDGEGQYLLPGLVELHTDHLERCLSPRPKVRWPLDAATVQHDRDLAAAGITTVCDAIAIGDVTPTSLRMTQYDPMIQALHQRQESGQFAIEHRLHLRCELAYDAVAEIAQRYAQHPLLSLISLMDHTPGQRQFAKLDKFREYYMGKHGVSAAEIDDFIQERLDAQKAFAVISRTALVELARSQNLAWASHDDATVEHVQQAIAEGATIAEFPTTLEAAKASHQHGLQVLMGAPNLVLGGSHSGNVSAMELVMADLVDIISSDYVPHSLLQSVFIIAAATGKPIHEAMRPVTINPAIAIQLDRDRGSLELGKRADLLTVCAEDTVPRLTSVICAGRRVA
ncbi:alpha-D-ribose 1-methylphosphonate 5-triphosphate diphosphatase [Romeria aff. gracilis LEGE 07310]|uniref:Alpha-D-ribose 1-methylphosphonate 5-triphosphate diphosphatase n=1 Tax=Vasconcelosia minhoensis LEGE 07310 TaxID=915328 RepID=A0A8J7DB61_9CYAN|nr:alpha-D-ribose 1-methylphosphonate 5-triphosphate diphosphatase [Romeria gracilis]MBE9075893.1 alpha-D-ribose 1-methylphosphonate 5-triphosphate diphosphatase [Romeria aff. gracilis LEGE 07310]